MRPGCGGFGIRNFLTLFLSIEVNKAMSDLAAARATIIELELENTALRTALDRHRTAMREDATLRSQLEEARRARAAAEHAKNAEARQCDELRFQLRQAEAESERLRTLLAGTIWFDMKT
jgi:predicted RNase H-like nuclease (RuvC/YqgF family)